MQATGDTRLSRFADRQSAGDGAREVLRWSPHQVHKIMHGDNEPVGWTSQGFKVVGRHH